MKVKQIDLVKDLHFLNLAASAVFVAAIAVAASVGFVRMTDRISIDPDFGYRANPPEHEIKPDLFEALETPANQAAANFLPRSAKVESVD